MMSEEQKARNRKASDIWKANNVERNKAKQLEYYYANREKRLAYMKEYQKMHPKPEKPKPEKQKEYAAKAKANMTPEQKAARAAYNKAWCAKNKEHRDELRRARAEASKEANKEKRLLKKAQAKTADRQAYRRAYYLAHKDDEASKRKRREWEAKNKEQRNSYYKAYQREKRRKKKADRERIEPI